MTSPTDSATKHQGPMFRIARQWRLVPRRHRRRKTAPLPTPRPSSPAFRKVWKEVAPGQWQVLHVYDEVDQKK